MNEISTRLLVTIQERKMSYSELAEQTGIAKSAIQRYATGETKKIPLPRLELLASALHVPAAYLMGWTDDSSFTTSTHDIMSNGGVDDKDNNESNILSQEEEKLLSIYRSLNERGRAELMFQAESYAGRDDFKANDSKSKAI